MVWIKKTAAEALDARAGDLSASAKGVRHTRSDIVRMAIDDYFERTKQPTPAV